MDNVVAPPAVRRLITSSAVSAIGTGFVLPLILIYLHRVRHIPLATTGLLMAIPGVIGLVVLPLSGALIDHVGAKRVLAGSLALVSVAEVGMTFVSTAGWAAAALLLRGAALGPTFPSFNTMLGSLAEGRAQQRAFAINFTFLNAGIGIGGLVGSAVIDIKHPWTFQLMFVGDAVASASAAGIVLTVKNRKSDHAASKHGESERGSYRQVLADPGLRRLVVITLLLALCGYAALDSGLPAFANVVAGVSPRVVALSLSANTLVIVALQLVVLKMLRGKRRSHAIVTVGLIWSGAWLLFGLAAFPGSYTVRAAIVIGFAALFGFGECFMATSVSPLINALATDDMRGRANALTGGMFSLAFVVSPAISAGLIALGLGGLWIGLLSAGCLVVSFCALQLSRKLTPAQDIATEATDENLIELDPLNSNPVTST
jgi:MFS family permease